MQAKVCRKKDVILPERQHFRFETAFWVSLGMHDRTNHLGGLHGISDCGFCGKQSVKKAREPDQINTGEKNKKGIFEGNRYMRRHKAGCMYKIKEQEGKAV